MFQITPRVKQIEKPIKNTATILYSNLILILLRMSFPMIAPINANNIATKIPVKILELKLTKS